MVSRSLLGDGADGHQDLAQQHLGLFLHVHRLGQDRLVDEAVADQEMAQVLLGVARRRRDHLAGLEEDPLLDVAVVDHQGAGLARLRQPLQELGELHGLEVAGDAHGQLDLLTSCRTGRSRQLNPRRNAPSATRGERL